MIVMRRRWAIVGGGCPRSLAQIISIRRLATPCQDSHSDDRWADLRKGLAFGDMILGLVKFSAEIQTPILPLILTGTRVGHCGRLTPQLHSNSIQHTTDETSN